MFRQHYRLLDGEDGDIPPGAPPPRRGYNPGITNALAKTNREHPMRRVVGLFATLYRELRDSHKIFRPEWDWWRWGIGLWLDADLDPGFDWTHLLFFIHLGPFRLTMGLEDND